MKNKVIFFKIAIPILVVVIVSIIINQVFLPKLLNDLTLYSTGGQQQMISLIDTEYNDSFYLIMYIYASQEKQVVLNVKNNNTIIARHNILLDELKFNPEDNTAWFTEIKKSFKTETNTVYEFNWGVLYSKNAEFKFVSKNNYKKQSSNDTEFKKIYEQLNN